MAIILYQSNRLEDLATLFVAILQKPRLSAILSSETILLPDQGVAKWLNIKIIEQAKSTSNFNFQLSTEFFWSLLHTIIPVIPEHSPYCVELLTERIYQLLCHREVTTPIILDYLERADLLRTYQFAQVLATLFSKYIVYRPDWILAWEANKTVGLGEDEPWQAQLWQRLIDKIGLSWGSILSQFRAAVATHSDKLPKRIVCFNLTNLPSLYLNLFETLAEHTDVHYLVLNPCREQWIDDRDDREQLRLAGRADPDSLYLEPGHPLLSSWGKQGRDYFTNLGEVPSIDVFKQDDELTRNTVLQCLQADILCRQITVEDRNKIDDSIQIHACHTVLREVEVLHDAILSWLENDPTLMPADIIVMAPNITDYSAYIEAVFTAPDAPVQLPFTIVDQNRLHQSALCQVLLTLLTFPTQRFDLQWLIDALYHPALLRYFGLAPQHLPLLREWLRALGTEAYISRGIQQECASDPYASWQYGLTQLLLACQLEEVTDEVITDDTDNLLATTLIVSPHIIISFSRLLQTLLIYLNRLTRVKSLKEWVIELFDLVETFFMPDAAEKEDLVYIQDQLSQLAIEAVAQDTQQPITVDVMVWILQQRLAAYANHQDFLRQGATFCSMAPLRVIPARIICIVGLNHDAFPRQLSPIEIDLMRHYPHNGDPTAGQTDRYFLLQLLISARDRLYLSYQGQDMCTNQTLPPSAVVDELLDTLERGQYTDVSARQAFVCQHHRQPSHPSYFSATSHVRSFQAMWLQVAQAQSQKRQPITSVFKQPLPAVRQDTPILLATLLAFYRHPIKYFLHTRLNILLPWQSSPINSFILLSAKDRVQLRQQILRDQAQTLDKLRSQHRLPTGLFGEFHYQEERQCIEDWQARTREQTFALEIAPYPVGAWQLEGTLPHVNTTGGIRLQSLRDTPSEVERISGWIQHLLLCLVRSQLSGYSVITGLYKGYRYPPLPADEAEALLLPWLTYFIEGLSTPLPLFARSSMVFAEQLQRGKMKSEALLEAEKAFMPTKGWAEGQERYTVAAYGTTPVLDERFIVVAETLLLPLWQHQEEINDAD